METSKRKKYLANTLQYLIKSLRDWSQLNRIGQGVLPLLRTSLHHHIKHHDPHAEEIPGEAEISDGEGPKIPKENRRKMMRVEECQAWHENRFVYHLRRHLHRVHPRRPPLVD